jgi:hypothetical protein
VKDEPVGAFEVCANWKRVPLNRTYYSHTSFYSPVAIRGTPYRSLALCETLKHPLRIDRDEQALTTSQHLSFFVQDLGNVDVFAAFHFHLARLHPQGMLQRHRPQISYGHLRGYRDHMAQLVYLAHRFIEDGRDDSAMAMSWRSAITLAQSEVADETFAIFVEGKTQPHTRGIVGAAGEAIIFLQFDIARIMPCAGPSWFGLHEFGSHKFGSNRFRFLNSHRKILSRAGSEAGLYRISPMIALGFVLIRVSVNNEA